MQSFHRQFARSAPADRNASPAQLGETCPLRGQSDSFATQLALDGLHTIGVLAAQGRRGPRAGVEGSRAMAMLASLPWPDVLLGIVTVFDGARLIDDSLRRWPGVALAGVGRRR